MWAIETSSFRLRWIARVARLFPPGVSGFFLRLYPLDKVPPGTRYKARSSLGRSCIQAAEPELVSLHFAIRGFFDWQAVVIAAAVCRPGDVIYDIGGNIGTESLLLSEVVGPGGAVECFEPLPENQAALNAHIGLNDARHIRVHPNAVADRATVLHFSRPPRSNMGTGYLTPQADGNSIDVQTVVLDDLLARGVIRPPRFIHIDVQGAEPFVLRGAHRILTEARSVLAVESAPECLAIHGFTPRDVLNILEAADYSVYEIEKYGLGKPREDIITDWLALPNRPARADQPAENAAALARRIAGRIRRAALLPLIPGLNPAVVA